MCGNYCCKAYGLELSVFYAVTAYIDKLVDALLKLSTAIDFIVCASCLQFSNTGVPCAHLQFISFECMSCKGKYVMVAFLKAIKLYLFIDT